MLHLPPDAYRSIVRRALDEDVGPGDVTTDATVSPTQHGRGVFVVKSPCVIAGLDVAAETFRQLEPAVQIRFTRADGDACSPGDEIGTVLGHARTLLVAERTALNFLQRLSGIATRARSFVDAADGRITILDTRKTTPTLRALEKHAVAAGGASNHRIGLYDAILIKDNHIRLAGGAAAAIAACRASRPDLRLEIEAQSLAEFDEALAGGADTILVDNMSTADITEAVRRARAAGRTKIEISGGVTLERIPELASTGADYVSVGGLTHSAPAADISFEIEPL
jgi:nicotinate-nucleotide pyrophosphorylase (carboxylating)